MRVVLLAALALLLPLRAASAGGPVATEALHGDLWWSMCSFYLPKKAAGSADDLAARAAKAFPGHQLLRTFPDEPRAGIVVVLDKIPGPVPADSLDYFAVGLSKREQKLLMAPPAGAMIAVISEPSQGPASVRAFHELAATFAASHKGVIWDDNTREGFNVDSWNERRAEDLASEPIRIGSSVTIHVYRDGSGFRYVTLGMDRFGLPDLVIEQAPTNSDDLGALIEWIGQQLYEDASLGKGAVLELDPTRLKSASMISYLQGRKRAGATLRGRIQLVEGSHQEGDADGPLVELKFDVSAADGSRGERIATLTTQLFGDSDQALTGDGSGLEGAKRRARRELGQLMSNFDSLAETASLLVKAGFDTTEQHTEHMWVAIVTVSGDQLTGTLLNQPFNGTRFRKGQQITFPLSAVSDFLLTLEDGTTKGNYTERFLR